MRAEDSAWHFPRLLLLHTYLDLLPQSSNLPIPQPGRAQGSWAALRRYRFPSPVLPAGSAQLDPSCRIPAKMSLESCYPPLVH